MVDDVSPPVDDHTRLVLLALAYFISGHLLDMNSYR